MVWIKPEWHPDPAPSRARNFATRADAADQPPSPVVTLLRMHVIWDQVDRSTLPGTRAPVSRGANSGQSKAQRRGLILRVRPRRKLRERLGCRFGCHSGLIQTIPAPTSTGHPIRAHRLEGYTMETHTFPRGFKHRDARQSGCLSSRPQSAGPGRLPLATTTRLGVMTTSAEDCWRLSGDCSRWAMESGDSAARLAFRQMATAWARLAFSEEFASPAADEHIDPTSSETSEPIQAENAISSPVVPPPTGK